MLSGGVLDEVGGVLDEVDVEVGDQSNSTVALAGTAHLYLTMTAAMSLALCHSNTAKIKVDSRMLSTRQASKNQAMHRRTDTGTLEITGSSILFVEVDSHVATGDR